MSTKKEEFWQVVRELLEKKLENQAFLFQIPDQMSEMIDLEELTEEQEFAIKDFAKTVRKMIKKSDFRVKKWGIRDKSKTNINVFPLPAPYLHVVTETQTIRYEMVLFLQENQLILSLKRIKNEKSWGFAGINFSAEECKLIWKILDVLAKIGFWEPILLNRRLALISLSRQQQWTLETALWLQNVPATIDRLPMPVVFCAVHAILAAVMSEFPMGIKPLYYPALRLSDNEAAESLQLQTLRALMRDLNFTTVKTCMTLWQTEFEVQDTQAIEVLRKISHMPLLVRVERDKVQRILSLLMQHARGDAFYGHSDYPLGTLPILIGSTLPPDSLCFTLDWPAFEAPGSGDLAVLRDVAKVIVAQRERFIRCFARQLINRTVGIERYEKVYISNACAAIDEILGSETKRPFSHWANGLFAQHEMQQTEQLERFDRAVQLLRDRACWDDVVAPSAKEMGAGSLAFWYKGKMEQHCIAFELKDSFPRFLESRLGMRRADSEEFRSHLKTLGLLEKMSQNVRGQNGKSTAHVLLPVCIWEKPEEHMTEICDL
ncbi:hypothetical protein [Butyricicoccus pullicaecorum]|uniref:Uncharacterized protein n=1 Tax=Butyricicoccus pullicaecorum TaxID=501571 RepID=A0A1Y4LI05_9FIRM|nr:hypothetical protein [Butyricicoccus pullicaecorum]OUP56333.1 hypothetical protein B5F15_12565 [Butyricicoccus pullicaecorum]